MTSTDNDTLSSVAQTQNGARASEASSTLVEASKKSKSPERTTGWSVNRGTTPYKELRVASHQGRDAVAKVLNTEHSRVAHRHE